jgi:hypothetical protein
MSKNGKKGKKKKKHPKHRKKLKRGWIYLKEPIPANPDG